MIWNNTKLFYIIFFWGDILLVEYNSVLDGENYEIKY